MTVAPGDLMLQPLTGPTGSAESYAVARPGPATVGRSANCEVCLLDERISRRHATLTHKAGAWHVADLGSVHGTWVNGVRLSVGIPTRVAPGDLLRVGPVTFRVDHPKAPGSSMATIDDSGTASQRIERLESVRTPAAQRLALLTACIGRLQHAGNERELADAALDSALAGTGYARAALLRPIGGADVEVISTRRARQQDTAEFSFSRSLVHAANAGQTVILASNQVQAVGHSIAELGIHSAVCAPVLLDQAVTALLYLDARGNETQVHRDAAGFTEAVATAMSMAFSNLKRAELQRRQSLLAAELSAAHEAQQFILPKPEARLGFIEYAVEVRPGVFVAGDLFDVIPTDAGVAVILGDAAGHGAGSAMMMATTQAFLHAHLRRGAELAGALDAASLYVAEHCPSGRFVSLWAGLFKPDGTLEYVDAGHGYWCLRRAGGPPSDMGAAGEIPLGIDPSRRYVPITIRLNPGDRVVVYSDGLAEQRGAASPVGTSPPGVSTATGAPLAGASTLAHPVPGPSPEFGRRRLLEALTAGTNARDDVDALFDAVVRYAGTASLTDDATAASIQFLGPA